MACSCPSLRYIAVCLVFDLSVLVVDLYIQPADRPQDIGKVDLQPSQIDIYSYEMISPRALNACCDMPHLSGKFYAGETFVKSARQFSTDLATIT